MISDPELEQWSELFRAEEGIPVDIAARAQKAVRRFRLWIYAEIVVTAAAGGGTTVWAANARQTSVTLLAVWVWIALAIAWLFRLVNDWNDFTGVAVATDSFLRILLRRLRSNLRASSFGGIGFLVQLLVMSAWVFRELNRNSHVGLRDYLALPANIMWGFGTVVFYVWLVRYQRRLRSEIAELERLRGELGDESMDEPIKDKAGSFPVVAHAASLLDRFSKKRKGCGCAPP